MIRCKNVFFLIVSLCVFFLMACPTTAPLQQRAASKTALERAKSVKAEIFSKEKYSLAVQNFDEGESLIDREKKTKENAKAQKSYEMSKEKADLAHAEAVGPFAQSLVDEAEVQISLAKEEGFVENNIEHFPDAVKIFDEAKMNLQEKKYDDFFAQMKDFDKNMALARDLFGALVARLAEVQAQEKSLNQQAIDQKVLNAAPKEYEKVSQTKDMAFAALLEKNYEKAIGFFQETIAQLESTLVIIKEKRDLAREELNRAEEVLDTVKNRVEGATHPPKDDALNNIDAVKIK